MRTSKIGRGKWLARVDKMYLRWMAYGMILLAVSLLQSAPRLFPAIGGAHPTLWLPVVVGIAMFEGPLAGAAVGVGSGLLWALYTNRLFGLDALLLMVIGCVCGLLVQVLLRNNHITALLLNAVVTVLYTLLDWCVRYVLFANEESWYAPWHILLPNAVYTFVLSPLVYVCIYRVARNLRETE